MSGERFSYPPRQTHSRIDIAIYTLVGIVSALCIVYLAFSMLEASLAREDRVNQEQLVWTCNGNGDAGTGFSACLPYSKA